MDYNEISQKVMEDFKYKSLIGGDKYNSDVEAIGYIDMEFTDIKAGAYDVGEMIKYFKDSIKAEDDKWGKDILQDMYSKAIILAHDFMCMAASIKKAINTKENNE